MQISLWLRPGWLPALCILSLLLAACAGPTAPVAPGPTLRWQPLHQGLPPHAPVTTVAFDPHNSVQMAVAVYQQPGLYTSSDGGQNWRAAATLGQPLHALLYDHQQRGVLWAGSAGGLYQGKQRDGAWSWQLVADWPLAHAAFALVQSADGSRYAGGESHVDQPPAVWRSREGEAWQPLTPLPAPPGSAVLSVAVTPDRLLAGTDGFGLFVSSDSGQSWSLAQEIGATFVAALWVAPWNPDLLLARTRKGLFRSVDGASSWQGVGEALTGRVDAIGAAPDGAIFLGMSTGAILRSEDGGASWQPWGTLERDGLFYTLVTDPGNAAHLYAGTQHGLYESGDGGRSWTQIDAIGTFRATALVQGDRGTLYLGNDDGVYRWIDEDQAWQFRGHGLPRRTVRALAVAPGNPPILFAGTDAGVYRSQDGGVSWQGIGWPDHGVNGLLLHGDNANRLYSRLAFERIYSTDQALSLQPVWTARWEGMAQSSEVLAMAADPEDANRLYAGSATDLFVSDDGAESWRTIAPELRGQSVFTVVVDPAQPSRIYAGATNGLYRSEDRGETWTRLGLEEITVVALAWHAAHADVLYAGTKHDGVWRSGDGGRTWQASGLPATTLHVLVISRDGRWLYAASERGFWRADL